MPGDYKQLQEVKLRDSVKRSTQFKKAVPDFDRDKIPPDFAVAEKHLAATLVGMPPDEEELEDAEIDPDSGKFVKQKKFPICCKKTDFKSLGSGYPLYFEFIEYCCIFLFLAITVAGFYNIYTNLQGGDCNSEPDHSGNSTLSANATADSNAGLFAKLDTPEILPNCNKGFWTKLSVANKRNDHYFMEIQFYLNILYAVVIIIALHFYRASQRRLDEECDASQLTPFDYSVWLKDLPPPEEGHDMDEELKQHLRTNGVPGTTLNISQVNLGYNLEEYNKLESEKQEIIDDIQDAMKYASENDGKEHPSIKIPERRKIVADYDESLSKMRDEFESGKSLRAVGQAFVSFETQQELDQFLSYYAPKTFAQKCGCGLATLRYKGKDVTIEPAPEPSDIFWENLHISASSKFWRRSFSNCISVLILIFSTACILYGSYVEEQAEKELAAKKTTLKAGEKASTVKVQAIGIAASMGVLVMNSLLAFTIRALAFFEAYETKTEFYISIAQKLTVAQFANTAMVTLAVKAVFDTNFWGNGGLIQSMTMIFLSNALVSPLQSIIDVPYLIKQFTRRMLKKDHEQGKCFLTQGELHEVYEGTEFDIPRRYAGIMRTMFATTFYAPVIPLALVWSLVAMICNMLADKYVLLRRCKRPDTLSAKLSKEMTELLEWILPIYACGNFFFNSRILNIHENGNFVILALGLANAFIPMDLVNKLIWPPKEKELGTESYSEAVVKFEENYDRTNPATKRKAIKDYKEILAKYNAES